MKINKLILYLSGQYQNIRSYNTVIFVRIINFADFANYIDILNCMG